MVRAPREAEPTARPGKRRSTLKTAAGTALAEQFDPRRNSLNALRLLFALLVIVGHAGRIGFGVGGFGKPGFSVLRFAPSEVAVDGFFVISGYLICRSRVKPGPPGAGRTCSSGSFGSCPAIGPV